MQLSMSMRFNNSQKYHKAWHSQSALLWDKYERRIYNGNGKMYTHFFYIWSLLPIGVRAGGGGGAAAPPVSKIFGENAKNSGNKETINDGIEK